MQQLLSRYFSNPSRLDQIRQAVLAYPLPPILSLDKLLDTIRHSRKLYIGRHHLFLSTAGDPIY
jgi:hypothetical protein